ncbi:aldose 1-epimerase family protein [Granulosicoccus antarcticus]|uniref:Aldose 1-epimerase n=1 Tax=Granulosicoccus antarcticus IMCC3135 TaxID=1192854 RepID=A0A2Z2NST5_9GAMM|nr:aldose 1-epimerase family protein [Granulosicoccus antarcticus]ASJ73575.1 hypothetical protein IMCC3135_17470 [Granulosicoccus antarcticus IMCC3135]
MHTIKNKNIEATINPVGAELSSLKINEREYLWHGDEKYWSGRAPILFPIVGALKEGRMSYQGADYQMGRHGFAKHATFECIASSSTSISMRLQSDSLTLQQYPWQFELLVHFILNDSGMDIRYEVINRDDKPMLFTIGSHPAFALDINDPAELADYTIMIDQSEPLHRYDLYESGLLNTVAEPHASEFSLSETLFNNDALVFRDITAESVKLSHKGQTMLTVNTGGAPHLGIWSKPGAPYVCIEPWLATCDFADSDNQFENKPDLKSLEPGDTYEHSIGIVFPKSD